MKGGAITFGNDTTPGTGSVTSVAVAGLSPLFTANVANPNTTPSVTFAQVAQAANLVFAGPASGAAAAPTFRALVHADMPGIITRTVAQMQALAAVNGFFPGTWYNITDVLSAAGNFFFLATSTNTISLSGFGTLQNGNMASPVDAFIFYDLATDFITVFEDATNQNITYQTVAGTADDFKYDTFTKNKIINTLAGTGWASFASFDGNIIDECQLFAAFGDIFSDNTAQLFTYAGGAGPSNITGNTFGCSSSLGATDLVLTRCILGPGKILDIGAAYSAAEKVYIDGLSTFVVTTAVLPQINPDIALEVDLGNLLWPGILQPDDGANDLSSFLNGPIDHPVKWQPVGTVINMNDVNVPVIGGNIVNLVDGSTVPIDGNEFDFVVMEWDARGRYVTSIERIRT